VKRTEFTLRPIGILRTPYSSKSGLPIQRFFDRKSRGRAEIFGEFEHGLQDIEGFSHMVLL
jgi:tRNA (Thr-GGU) A37 N-methylase